MRENTRHKDEIKVLSREKRDNKIKIQIDIKTDNRYT